MPFSYKILERTRKKKCLFLTFLWPGELDGLDYPNILHGRSSFQYYIPLVKNKLIPFYTNVIGRTRMKKVQRVDLDLGLDDPN